MSTPTGFNQATPVPPARSGCKRGCLIAAVVLVVLMLVGGGVLFWKGKELVAWGAELGMNALQGQAVKSLAADVHPEARERFDAAFGRYRDFMRSVTMGELQPPNPASVGKPLEQLGTAIQDQSVTLEEVERFIELVDEATGKAE